MLYYIALGITTGAATIAALYLVNTAFDIIFDDREEDE